MEPSEYPSIYTFPQNFTQWQGNGTAGLDCSGPEIDPLCIDPNALLYEIPPFKLTVGKILSAIGMAMLIAISLSGNILVCTAFFYYQRLRTVTNYFVVSLAVSDLMVGALSMPLWLSYEVTEWSTLPSWVDYLALSRFLEFVDVLSAVSSIANLTAISIDRFFSIMSPLHHRTRMTPRVALIMLTLAWIYALGISLCRLIPNFVNYVAFTASMGFFIPLIIILGSYAGIYLKIRSKRTTLSRSMEKEWNVVTTLFIVTFLFVICWMPFFVLSLLYKYCKTCIFKPSVLSHLISLVKWMHYLNSGCNPFVYGFFNVNFKHAFKALFKKCCGRAGSESDFSMRYEEESVSFIRRPYNNIKRRLERRRRSQCGSKIVSDCDHSYSTLTSNYGTDKRRVPSFRSQNNNITKNSENVNGKTREAKNGHLRVPGYGSSKSLDRAHCNGHAHDGGDSYFRSSLKQIKEHKSDTDICVLAPQSRTGSRVHFSDETVDKKGKYVPETPIIVIEGCSSSDNDPPPRYDEVVDQVPLTQHDELIPETEIDNELLHSAKESCV